MRIQDISSSILCCLAVCSMSFSTLNQAQADVVYTLTGVANSVDNGSLDLSPQAGIGESFTAIFKIDDTALNTGAFPGTSEFTGAITSSSIIFSGGFSSSVDFSGGTVTVSQGTTNSGINLGPPIDPENENSGFFGFFSDLPFDSAAMFTTAEIVNCFSYDEDFLN